MDEMTEWLTAALDKIEQDENRKVTLTKSVRGRPCPVDEDGEPCAQLMTAIGFTQGDDRYEIEPCGHLATAELAFELLGAQPAPDRPVLARVEAERAVLRLHRPENRARGIMCAVCAEDIEQGGDREGDWPCDTRRWLAFGHRFDVDGYDPAWAPETVPAGPS